MSDWIVFYGIGYALWLLGVGASLEAEEIRDRFMFVLAAGLIWPVYALLIVGALVGGKAQ